MRCLRRNCVSKAALCIAALIMASGCVGLRTREEVNNQLGTKRQAQGQTQVTQIQKEKADAENKVLILQDEIKTLHGRLDLLEKRAQDNQSQPMGPTNADIIEQMKIFEQSNAALKSKIEVLEKSLAAAQSAAATPAPPPKAETAKSPATKPATQGKKSGPYDIAEDQFAKKEWKSAILSYQSYRDQNPKGKSYADATYKIGVSFQELNMKEEAKVFFEEVLQKFPKSPTARKAKFRLGQLK